MQSEELASSLSLLSESKTLILVIKHLGNSLIPFLFFSLSSLSLPTLIKSESNFGSLKFAHFLCCYICLSFIPFEIQIFISCPCRRAFLFFMEFMLISYIVRKLIYYIWFDFEREVKICI